MNATATLRDLMAEYALRWPVHFVLTAALSFYGVARMIDDLTGGAPFVTPRWIALRIAVALLVGFVVLLLARRRRRGAT